ncbi:hypothetical protein ACWDBW_42180 [Streptomyces sp. NPDC001107]
MSPEQAEGVRELDHRSDLYSLGCLLYHAVAGGPPFMSGNPLAVLRMQVDDAPVAPGQVVKGLPGALNDLILSLLAKDPGSRPADAAEVCETLSALLADHAATAPGENLLDLAQLGHHHSVPGRILRRTWEQLTEARVRAEELLTAVERRKAALEREAKELGAVIQKATTPTPAEGRRVDEEDYYWLFRQSINGRYPTADRFQEDLRMRYGVSLPPDVVLRMVNRFTHRFNAELEEDHIA